MLTVTVVRYTYIHSGFVLYTFVVLVTRSIAALWLLRMGSTSWVALANASLQRDLLEFAHTSQESHTVHRRITHNAVALVLLINELSQCPHTLPRTIIHVPCHH